jgi:hypothetical protein
LGRLEILDDDVARRLLLDCSHLGRNNNHRGTAMLYTNSRGGCPDYPVVVSVLVTCISDPEMITYLETNAQLAKLLVPRTIKS